MGVLDVLSGLSTAAGKAVQGYGIDQDSKVTQLLAQQKAAQEAERSRVLNLLTQREISTPRLGDASYAPAVAGVEGAKAAAVIPAKVAEANAMIAPKVAEQSALAPGDVKKAADTVAATTPITSSATIREHAVNRDYDNAHQPPDKPSVSVQQPLTPGEPAQAVVIDPTDPAHPKVSATPIPGVAKSANGLGAGTPQQKASLEAGLSTLRQADADANAYEDKVLAAIRTGKSGGAGYIAGQLGAFANPANHPDLSPMAGGLLNVVDKDYATYTKSLSAAANAGMLIAQRPSDVRMKKEELLSGVRTNPTEDQVLQARQWRANMIAAFESVLGGNNASKPATGSHTIYSRFGLTPPPTP